MSPTIVLLLTFVAVSLMLLAASSLVCYLLRYRILLRRRLHDEFHGQDDAARLFKDLQKWEGKSNGGLAAAAHWLRQLTEQSGLSLTPQTLLVLSGAAGLAAGVVAWAISAMWCVAAIAAVSCSAVPIMYVLSRRKARLRKLCRQLPEAFEMMSRAVRIGQTATAAMQLVADEFDSPISDEFALCYQQQDLGMSTDVALRNLADRGGVMELQIFVMGLLVQSRSGGNLTELLDNLATIVRSRLRMQAKIKAFTSEGRMQALVLMLLPVAALIALLVLSPEYVSVFFDRPWMLGAIGAAHAVAAVWIRSIVKLDA